MWWAWPRFADIDQNISFSEDPKGKVSHILTYRSEFAVSNQSSQSATRSLDNYPLSHPTTVGYTLSHSHSTHTHPPVHLPPTASHRVRVECALSGPTIESLPQTQHPHSLSLTFSLSTCISPCRRSQLSHPPLHRVHRMLRPPLLRSPPAIHPPPPPHPTPRHCLTRDH